MIIINPPEFYGRKCNVCGDKNALCEINFRNDHNNHGNVVALCPDCAETLVYIVESYKEGMTMPKEHIERDKVLSHKWKVRSYDPSDPDPVTEVVSVSSIMCIPAADVVEVVRCRDCYFREFDGADVPVCTGAMAYSHTPDDWFCAAGKPKDGGRDDAEIH